MCIFKLAYTLLSGSQQSPTVRHTWGGGGAACQSAHPIFPGGKHSGLTPVTWPLSKSPCNAEANWNGKLELSGVDQAVLASVEGTSRTAAQGG